MSVSVSLTTGALALQAAQVALDTAANNIANANTPGYSRESVLLEALPPPYGGPQTGTGGLPAPGRGVAVEEIQRIHDDMLDGQYRSSAALSSGDSATASALQQIESAFGEPSSTGIQASLTAFFNSFSDLATQPESTAARTAAIEQGGTLSTVFNSVSANLTSQRTALDQGVVADVSQINADAQQIATLNGQIATTTEVGQAPNSLMDQRDALLDTLAGLAGTTASKQADGSVTVSIGGHALVTSTTVDQLQAVADPSNNNLNKVVFASDSSTAAFNSGEESALLGARDTKVAGAISALNSIAQTLMTAVNTAHEAGYGLDGMTNEPFFTGTGAGDIAVNADLVSNPQHLAVAGAASEPGDASVATAIAGIENAKLMNGGASTIGDNYAATVAALGSATAEAQQLQSNQSAVTAQIDSARQAVSGVSIDEETTNLMQDQRAYQAAAQVISVTDSMLGTLVSMALS